MMADEFDVEAMLEAPYNKNNDDDHHYSHHDKKLTENGRKHRSRSIERSRGHDKYEEKAKSSRDRRARSTEKSRRRSAEREKRRSRSRDKKRVSRSRSREKKRSVSRERDRKKRSKTKERRRSRSKEKRRSKSKERRRSKSKDKEKRKSRSTDRSKERKRSRSRRRSRSKEKRRRSPSPRPFRRGRTPPNGLGDRSPPEDLSPEERDARTVFCMQLSQRIRARDLEEFFSSVGKVRDVRLITCNKTRRFKGIAYIEFKDPESVALALGLSGQKLLGIPISVQHTQAEKNRIANSVPTFTPKNHTGPMRLFVGSLHFNITEDMLRGIFEPFGKIDNIQLVTDSETLKSKGYGFITYRNADDAKKALEQLNGFELAGRPMKVGNVTERLDMNTTSLDTDEMDRSGIDLGATGRLQLMFKLAEGAGLAVPQAAANALLATAPQPITQPQQQAAPAIATQCFMLSNMFDPKTETNPSWDSEIRDDVIDECTKHGGVLHIFVDKTSAQGNVYVKCPSITTAVLAVNALHGRWFAGRVITAAYVPLTNYHLLFPDALTAVNLLTPARK
ncbi:RNA-binding protein 39 isoform X2 [Condylostylus longicornis]|uniref:RNA-binding protein 39 isoform X2 n=1 Tax=Condylostylus longicornis TaxID=2530218 RepID=UPI00244DFB35|nr:RNA-binding protein 39 isoform X2 [Condylostylus longicornis]